MSGHFTFVAALLLTATRLFSQEPSRSAISSEMTEELGEQIQTNHLAGAAAVVLTSHAILGLAAEGVRRKGESPLLQPTDLFHLGSNTKAITATMVARLVEAGKVSWTTTPLDVFPELQGKINPAFRRITLEQLLSHHAGIPPFTTVNVKIPGKSWPKPWPRLKGTPIQQRAQFAALVLKHRPAVQPGTKGLYSNADIAIAAAMAERTTGSSWEQLVTSLVFQPLGMRAIFDFPLAAGENQPWGHFESKNGLLPLRGGVAAEPPYMLPAGGVALSLPDYGRFLQMNLKGLRGEETGFLLPSTIQRLHTSSGNDPYALGWGRTEVNGVMSNTHAGSDGSFYAIVALQPSRDIGVAVILNSSGEHNAAAAELLLQSFLKKYAAAAPQPQLEGVPPHR